MENIAERLCQIIKEKSFLRGEFTLSSGAKSNFYFDGKMTTLSPEGAYLVGKRVFDLIKDAGIDAIGGVTIGGDPIVAAVAVISHLEQKPIPAFIVRKDPKKHGTQKYVEGHLPNKKGCRVAIVDDVLTTGKSLLESIAKVEDEGCEVAKVIVVVDRQQGGKENLHREGYEVVPLYYYDAAKEDIFKSC